MSMNKRGILMVYVLIFTILAVSLALTILFKIENQKYTFEIGEVPTKVIRSYVLANEEEYFLKSQLEEKSKESIINLLNNAGLENPVYSGEYILWKKDIECFPNDWNKLKSIIISDLGAGYDIFRNDEGLIVEAKFPIVKKEEDETYNLVYTKEFNENYVIEGFNFDEFISKVDKIKSVVDECGNLESCWESKSSGFNYKKEGNLFKISFTTQSLEKEISIKIGIDFEEELNFGEEGLKC